ncbi:MAG: glycosyltransferase [Phycisphaeraceae bacterium]|nr:glycosyltransferase [Phycisphaeraceae bacterium]
MIIALLLGFSLLVSLGALAMTLANLRLYRCPSGSVEPVQAFVSVCIPARNEEANIEDCVRSLLASTHARLEILVYDDQSTDATPKILSQLADEDQRVRPLAAIPLPPGWNGKQHACWQCANHASGEYLLFTDADVRFEPTAIATALAAWSSLDTNHQVPLGLISTFPRQIVRSPAEVLLVPMIFFILFAYLPMFRMRGTTDPSTSAACGQFILVSRPCYDAFGGHAAFKDTMHDGVKMPREARRAGFTTDLFDGTAIASVRMYDSLTSTWKGFAKNAYEGLGSPALLVFLTFLHLLGHLLPWVTLPVLLLMEPAVTPALLLAKLAIGCQIALRGLLAWRFRLPILTALLHPLGVLAMVLVQWDSFRLHRSGKRSWRGRAAQTTP